MAGQQTTGINMATKKHAHLGFGNDSKVKPKTFLHP